MYPLATKSVNALMGTSNCRATDSNTLISILAFDGWAVVTFGTARRKLGGLRPRPVPSSLYQM